MSGEFKLRNDRNIVVAILALLTLFSPATAKACDVAIVPITSTMRFDYDPFAFAPTVGRLTFDIESRDSEACEVTVMLLDAKQASISDLAIGTTGVVVGFQARGDDAAMSPTAVPGAWRLRIAPGKRTRLSIEGLVTQDAVALAGDYATDLTLELRDPGAAATHAAPMPVHVLFATMPRAQMNIVGAAGTFGEGPSIARVDFGILASKATRRVFLQVRANGRARLTIDSANSGRLVREGGKEPGIPYTARLVDDPVDLTQHWEKAIDLPRTVGGASLPFDLMLEEIGANIAGSYSDVLTLQLSAI